MSWSCIFFLFRPNLCPEDSEKKLGATIRVDNNKPKSERLFGTIYLKIVCSISSNFIRKCLLFDVNSEKDSIIQYSLKMLIVFYMNSEKVFIVYLLVYVL